MTLVGVRVVRVCVLTYAHPASQFITFPAWYNIGLHKYPVTPPAITSCLLTQFGPRQFCACACRECVCGRRPIQAV